MKPQRLLSMLMGSAMLLFCSASLSYALTLPATGQTLCYDASGNIEACSGTGEDGALQMGIAWPSPRFTANGDTTLTDNLTTLIWPPDGGTTSGGSCGTGAITWEGALQYVQCLNTNNYLGHNDCKCLQVYKSESQFGVRSEAIKT